MCPLVKLNTIFNLGNPNIPLEMRERQRLKSFGRERENKVVGLLRLDCTFPFFFRVILYFS